MVEEVEYQQGITDVRGRRALRATTTRQQDTAAELQLQEVVAKANIKAAALLYVQCLQQLLQVGGKTGPLGSCAGAAFRSSTVTIE